MSPAAADASNDGALTRSRIESWPTGHLRDAPAQWRAAARESLQKFEQYQRSVADTDWTGDAKDAAVDAADCDLNLVRHQRDVIEEMAITADDGHEAVTAAKRDVTNAIASAERDGFRVDEGLNVRDSRKIDVSTMADRFRAAKEHAEDIQWHGQRLVETHSAVGDRLRAQAGTLRTLQFTVDSDASGDGDRRNAVQAATYKQGPAGLGDAPLTPGENVFPDPGREVEMAVPPNRLVGDARFGHWAPVTSPAPLKPEYHPLDVSDDPTKLGGTTAMYTPGRTWVQDSSAPYAQYQEEYRFRIAGQEDTTFTRTVTENGVPRQERWVQNVYEYQRNTQTVFGGDVEKNGVKGSLSGLPPILTIDNDWKRIPPQDIASLSAHNPTIKYYLPDGCGGQFIFKEGVPVGGFSGLPPVSMTPGPGEIPPSMHRPR